MSSIHPIRANWMGLGPGGGTPGQEGGKDRCLRVAQRGRGHDNIIHGSVAGPDTLEGFAAA